MHGCVTGLCAHPAGTAGLSNVCLQGKIKQLQTERELALQQGRPSLEQSSSAHAAELGRLQDELDALKGVRYDQVKLLVMSRQSGSKLAWSSACSGAGAPAGRAGRLQGRALRPGELACHVQTVRLKIGLVISMQRSWGTCRTSWTPSRACATTR